MDFVDFIPLISAAFVFFLGLVVFQKNKKSRVNFTFFLHALAITVWLFGTFMMFLNKNNAEGAIFWDRFVYAGVVFIVVFMHHFRLAFTKKQADWMLYLGYALSFVFLILSRTPYFVDGVFVYKWGIHTQAKIFHHIFLIYFAAYTINWFIGMYAYYKNIISPVLKEQTKYIFIGFLALFSIGPIAYLPAYGIEIYPFAYISGLIFSIIIAYAIIVHRLMDIKLVMRRSTVLIFSVISIAVPAFFIKFALYRIFDTTSDLVDIAVLIVSISLFPAVKNYYYKLANRYFFSSLYDAKAVIEDISDRLSSTLEIKNIYGFISGILLDTMHVRSIGILTYDSKKKEYVLQHNVGIDAGKRKSFKDDANLQKDFAEKSDPIIIEELKTMAYDRYKDTIDLMESLGIEVLIPLDVKDKPIGLMVLGAKESGDMYNEEDLGVLKIVGSQMAISLENALLYEKTRNFNRKLKQEVEVATADLRSANEKLKKLDEAKSEFISIASHQLRTPLTAIKGYISMMLEGDFGQLTDAEMQSLEKVFDSNERLIKLVENLLNVSRIESGRLQFNFEEVQLEKMVGSVMEELTGNANKKGLVLKYRKPEKPLPKVNIDDEKIRQVVMNLIDNAIKYTKKGTVTVDLKQSDNSLEFSVSDSGMGISSTDLPNLFQKFSRGTGTSLVHTEGTGLGLYVARQMMEAHHGTIWAESKGEGMGSRFCFKLPISQ